MGTFGNSEDPDEMQHNSALIMVHTVFRSEKDLQTIFFYIILVLKKKRPPTR